MDYIIYADKVHSGNLPTVTASTSSPKTAYHPGTDLVFVNTGSGWQPMVQPGTGSVYSAYSTASPTTQQNIVASVTNTSSAPHAAHTAVATKASEVAVRGR
jgi:hypothetical protein